VATRTLDAARLAALADAWRATRAVPTPEALAAAEPLLLAEPEPWLSFGDRVDACAPTPAAFRACAAATGADAPYVLCADGNRVRVLLYDDAAPRDVLAAALRARGLRAAAGDADAAAADDAAPFARAVADAGWRVDELPVAFDRGRLLRDD